MSHEENYYRLVSLVSHIGANVLREYVDTYLHRNGYSSLEELLNREIHTVYHCWRPSHSCCCGTYNGNKRIQSSLTNHQWNDLYENSKTVTHPFIGQHPCQFVAKATVSLQSLDITLCRFIIVKVAKGLRPGDETAIDDIRDFRNVLAHKPGPDFDDSLFQLKWQDVKHRLVMVAGYVSPQYSTEVCNEIDGLATKSLDGSECRRMIAVLTMMVNQDIGEQVEEIANKVTVIEEKQGELQTTVNTALSDISNRLVQLQKETVEGPLNAIKTTDNSKRNNILEDTKLVLKAHQKSLYVPQTRILEEARQRLQAEGVTILMGKCGCGKTTTAKQLMVEFSDQVEVLDVYTPVILRSPDDWNMIANGNEKIILFIDDPFGKSNYDEKELLQWQKYFDQFMACTKEGNMIIVIGIRSDVLSECDSKIRNYDLFQKENIVDLSSTELQMTKSEKQVMFEAYCHSHNVVICYKEGEENLHTYKNTIRVGTKKEGEIDGHISFNILNGNHANARIALSSVERITSSNPMIGFPQSCYLFFALDSLFHQGISFFTNADKNLRRQINILRKSHPLQYCILAYMLLEGGEIDLEHIEETKFEKLQKCIRITSEIELFDIKDCVMYEISSAFIECQKTLLDDTDHEVDMDTSFGSDKTGDLYIFTHQSILESVLHSFCERYPRVFLELGNIHVISEFTRSFGYSPEPGEICYRLPDTHHIQLAETLVQRWGICAVAVHRTTTDPSFMDALFDVLDTSDNIGHALILVRYLYITADGSRRDKAFTAALHLAVRLDRYHFLKTMCSRYFFTKCTHEKSAEEITNGAPSNTKPKLSVKSFLLALNYFLEKGDTGFVKRLLHTCDKNLSHVQTSGECTKFSGSIPINSSEVVVPICFAAENKWKRLVLCLLERNVDSSVADRTGKSLLHYCCENNWLDIFEILVDKYETVLNQEDKLASFLMHAARYKSKDIVVYLMQRNDDLKYTDITRDCLLHFCCMFSWCDVLEDVLAKHTDMSRNKQVTRSLVADAAKLKSKECFIYLLHRVNEDLHIDKGNYLIHYCCENGWFDAASHILKLNPLSLDAQNSNGLTPLMLAIQNKHKDMTVKLLEAGADTSVPDNMGNLAVHYCCKVGWPDILGYILTSQKDQIDTQNKKGRTPLLMASHFYEKDVVFALLRREANIEIRETNGTTLLHYCCRNGWIEIAQTILESNLGLLKARNNAGETPLLMAAAFSQQDITNKLIKIQLDDLATADATGNTIIHYLCMNGWDDAIMDVLHIKPEIVTLKNNWGMTPLLSAACSRKKRTTMKLLKKGISTKAVDNKGNNVLHYCSKEGWNDVILQILKTSPELLDTRNNEGETPIFMAAVSRHLDTVYMMMKYGSDLMSVNNHGDTILHQVCINGWVDACIDILRKKQTLLNIQNADGLTPVLMAGLYGHQELIIKLLQNNADVKIPDNNGDTLLQYCEMNALHDVLEFMKQNKSKP